MRRIATAAFALAAWLGAALPPPAAHASSIVTEWLDETVPAANQTAWEPTVGARFLAIVHGAIYDAWTAYDPVAVGVFAGPSLRGTGGPPTVANKREAISYAAYETLRHLAPVRAKALAARMADLGYPTDADTPAARVGRRAAALAIEACREDGANEAEGYADTTGYAAHPPGDPSLWQPIQALGAAQLPLSPHWGRVMPFALADAAEFRPPPPAAPGTPAWDAQVATILDVSAHLTDRDKAIAEFWVPWGSPPAAHLMMLTKILSARDDLRLDDEVKLFLVVSMALHDTAIATWEAKYHYDYSRPITGVRALGERRVMAWRPPALPAAFAYSAPATRLAPEATGARPATTGEIAARDWEPYLPTPPFPAYVSGHATFTAAWARAAELVTGRPDFGYRATVTRLFGERRLLSPPVELDYPTLWSAAEASGISRIYGGIHWPADNTEGLVLGRRVADRTWQRAQAFFLGTAAPAGAAFATLSRAFWSVRIDETSAPPLPGEAGHPLSAALTPGHGAVWISQPLDPLPAGDYRLDIAAKVSGEARITLEGAVLVDDAKAPAAPAPAVVNLTAAAPAASLTWTSDGRSAFRVRLCASVTDGPADLRIVAMRATRVWDVKPGAARYREMSSAALQ